MTSELIVKSTLILAAIVLCALGVWHNDKMVAFEHWLVDRAAYMTAMMIVKFRKAKKEFKINLLIKSGELMCKLLGIDETYIDKKPREDVQDGTIN